MSVSPILVSQLISRVGFLLHDPEFDLDKFKQEGVTLRLRQETERLDQDGTRARCFIVDISRKDGEDREQSTRYSQKPCWAATPRGWERVQFSAQWSRGLNLPDTVLEDFRTGRRHLIRRM